MNLNKDKEDLYTKPLLIILFAIVCTALWGSASPTIKLSYQWFRIEQNDIMSKCLFAGIRFTLAGLIVIVASWISKARFPLPKKQSWGRLFELGVIQTSLQYLFFYIGVSFTTGAKGSLFSSISSFLVVLATPLIVKGERYSITKLFGCALGFSGLYLICAAKSLSSMSGFSFQGEGLAALSSVCFAVGHFCSKRLTNTEKPSVVTGWQMFIGGLILIILGYTFNGRIIFYGIRCLFIIIYLAILSAVAYTIWSTMLKYNPVYKISVFHLLTPVFGAILSGIILAENVLTIANIGSLLLVCTGIWLVNKKTSSYSLLL